MLSDNLTIRIESSDTYLDVDDFLSIVNNTLTLLRIVANNVSGPACDKIHWRISNVTLNSPLCLTVFADTPSQQAAIAIRAATNGLRELEAGSKTLPAGFDLAALDCSKRLVDPLNNGIIGIKLIGDESESLAPSQRVAATVDELLPKPYDEVGTIEGTLDSISVRNRRLFSVWDVFSDSRIECYFPEALFSNAKDALRRRVEVSGIIRNDRHGKPQSIRVSDVRVLRDQSELPQFSDLENLGLKLRGDVHELARRMWNGD